LTSKSATARSPTPEAMDEMFTFEHKIIDHARVLAGLVTIGLVDPYPATKPSRMVRRLAEFLMSF
jgi:hypothetical protein